ncbi:helix-turn-helix domain-containing protein [Eisenbergiella porci]|uniref:helix-turn-helix domain-containing protein n=1 Tax=Eisenbergiella porci TaxID=2652274 RepID=UPI002A7F42F5|nr:AraC family transcriptional regulator [Eisenbergiella porci]
MITVTNCGHDSHHPKPCNIEHKQGVPDYLILLIKQDSWLYIDNERKEIKPNSLICFPPSAYIHYGCDIAGYNDDWIHFILDDEENNLLDRLQLPLYRLLQPHDFHKLSEYVRIMSDAFHRDSSLKEQIMDSFMHAFLYSLHEEINAVSDNALPKYFSELSALRTRIYNNPSEPRIISELAASLCLSLSYFQHLYKQFFGCSCQMDIINARLKLAKYYLINSEMTIRGIADFCGYESELHFMRQFKKFTGATPSEYRRRKM